MDNFYRKIEEIVAKDSRYKADAYEFVMRALWFTQNKFKKQGHVSGKELLEGIKDLVLEQYGPMAKTVFQHWGIEATADFGEIVFNMVDSGLLNKTEKDSRDDFKNVYDFSETFNIFRNQSFSKLTASPKRNRVNQKPKISAAKSGSPDSSLFNKKNLN